jgi:hypothetical protein
MEEYHQPAISHRQTLLHNVVSSTPRLVWWDGFELTTLVMIGTAGTGSCKSNYHTITTTTAPYINWLYIIRRKGLVFIPSFCKYQIL